MFDFDAGRLFTATSPSTVCVIWIDSHTRDKCVTVGTAGSIALFIEDVSVLLTSSEQVYHHALDRFAATCNHAGMKTISRMTKVVSLENSSQQVLLHVSGSALQHVEKFKYYGMVLTIAGKQNKDTDSLILVLVMQTQCCVSIIVPMPQNWSFQTP